MTRPAVYIGAHYHTPADPQITTHAVDSSDGPFISVDLDQVATVYLTDPTVAARYGRQMIAAGEEVLAWATDQPAPEPTGIHDGPLVDAIADALADDYQTIPVEDTRTGGRVLAYTRSEATS